MTLEDVWAIREEQVYPALFGPVSRGIFPLPQALFTEQFRQPTVDPLWLSYGVLEFGPTSQRSSWLYVTSGHSNPWHEDPEAYDPSGESGAGVEFTLSSTDQGDWAIRTLQSMLAFDLLLRASRFPNGQPLSLGDRIPLRAPIDGRPACCLRNLVVARAEGIADEFDLPSGKVLLAGFTAISDAEVQFAKENSSGALIERLREAGAHPINDPARRSIY